MNATKTPRRSQLIGTLAVLLLVVVALVWINRSSDSPTTGRQDRTATTATAATSPTTSKTTTTAADENSPTDPVSGLGFVNASALPPQARDTLTLIKAGGPYPFPRNDDQSYFNNNRVLPRQPSGYYREYTVITPGSKTRGARRIIAGKAGELYYTADHYDSFRRIRENR